MLESLKYEDLAKRTSEREQRKWTDDTRVQAHERECAGQLGCAPGTRVQYGYVRQWKHGDEGREHCGERIDPEHHLLAAHAMPREYLVLGGVGRAIERKIDEQVRNANQVRVQARRRGAGFGAVLGFGGTFVAERHEERDTRRDHRDDEVLVRCKTAAVEEDVHKHHGHKLARLPKHHRRVRDVRERGEAKWRGGRDEQCTLRVAQ